MTTHNTEAASLQQTISEVACNTIVLLMSLGSTPGRSSFRRGRTWVGPVGKSVPPVTRGLAVRTPAWRQACRRMGSVDEVNAGYMLQIQTSSVKKCIIINYED